MTAPNIQPHLDTAQAAVAPRRAARAAAEAQRVVAQAERDVVLQRFERARDYAQGKAALVDQARHACDADTDNRQYKLRDWLAAGGTNTEPNTEPAPTLQRALSAAQAAAATAERVQTACAADLVAAEAVVTQTTNAVAAADEQIYKGYLDAIAQAMVEVDGVLRALHAELRSLQPSGINRPINAALPSELVERALALVVVDDLHTPVIELRGGTTHSSAWADRRAALLARGERAI